MKLHPEGKNIILAFALITGSLLILLWILFTLVFALLLSLPVLFLLGLTLRFFRVPERQIVPSEVQVLAPADGKVVALEKTTVNEYSKGERIQVSIFMSIHNVHKNWYPLSGTIVYSMYHPGKYLLARHPKSSELNERTSVVIRNAYGEVMVRQIAGYVARRIVCRATEGTEVTQNDELGFIKFGSRLDLFLPTDTEILVKQGDTAVAGKTVIGLLKK
jgi:phosphatidylserine decarboxylase